MEARREMSPVEVITSVQRRRRWTPDEKRLMVEETERPGMSVSAVPGSTGSSRTSCFTGDRFR